MRCCSHSAAPGFFGSAIKIDLFRSSGSSPSSYILFMMSVNFSTPYSSKASYISTTIPSGPAALFLLIILMAVRTSDFRIFGLSVESGK